MDQADLQVTIDTRTAFQKTKELEMQIIIVGETTDKMSDQATKAFQRMAQATNMPITALRDLDKGLATSTKGIFQVQSATAAAASAMGGGSGVGVPGGGGGGGGGPSGGGLSGAAGSAANSLANMTRNALGAVAAYLSLRQALRLGQDIVAARIEFDRLDFGLKAITGSWAGARREADFLISTSDKLGINLRSTIGEFIKVEAAFSQSGFTAKQTENLFTDLAVTTKALGLTSQQTGRILYDFQEMASLGTVQMRNFRAVMMQIPGGMDIAARSMGISTQRLHDLIHEGRLGAEDFLPRFAAELRNTFGGAMNEASQNLESNVNRMKNSWGLLLAELGRSPVINKFFAASAMMLEDVRIASELRGAGVMGDAGKEWSYLEKKFPYADPHEVFNTANRRPEFNEGFTPVDAYRHMQEQHRVRDQVLAGGMIPDTDPKQQRDATEAQLEALQKIAELQDKTHIERLAGLQQEEAQIDLNTTKQLQALDKLMATLDPTKDKDRIDAIFARSNPFADIMQGANALKAAAGDKFTARETGQLVDQYKALAEIRERLTVEGTADKEEQQIAAINEEYRKLNNTLVALSEYIDVPSELVAGLESARANKLGKVRPTRKKTRFSGESFGSLAEGLYSDRQALLTEDDEAEFNRIAERITERSNQLTLRLKANNADFAKSFAFGMQEASDKMGTFQERVAESGSQSIDALDRGFTEAFTGMIMGTKSVEKAFSEMATSIVTDLVRIAIQQYVVRSILSALSSGFGGGGGGSTVPANFSHQGGSTGESSSGRHVSPLAFFGARRYHTGGVIGDEVPIVARKGEVMFTPDQLHALGKTIRSASNSDRGRKIEILNLADASMVDERIAANPDLIVNAIGKRASVVRRLLA